MKLIALLLPIILAVGCTELARRPSAMSDSNLDRNAKAIQFIGDQDISIERKLYARALKDGEEWVLVGRVPEGEVFKPLQGVFTIKGVNVFEAYLVIQQRSLVGFYVPFDKSFVANRKRTTLNFREGQ